MPFQVGAAERFLAPTLDNEPPEFVAAPQLHLFLVQAFNPNNEGHGNAVAGNDNSITLRLANTAIQRCLFQDDRFHRISSVAVSGRFRRMAARSPATPAAYSIVNITHPTGDCSQTARRSEQRPYQPLTAVSLPLPGSPRQWDE